MAKIAINFISYRFYHNKNLFFTKKSLRIFLWSRGLRIHLPRPRIALTTLCPLAAQESRGDWISQFPGWSKAQGGGGAVGRHLSQARRNPKESAERRAHTCSPTLPNIWDWNSVGGVPWGLHPAHPLKSIPWSFPQYIKAPRRRAESELQLLA